MSCYHDQIKTVMYLQISNLWNKIYKHVTMFSILSYKVSKRFWINTKIKHYKSCLCIEKASQSFGKSSNHYRKASLVYVFAVYFKISVLSTDKLPQKCSLFLPPTEVARFVWQGVERKSKYIFHRTKRFGLEIMFRYKKTADLSLPIIFVISFFLFIKS